MKSRNYRIELSVPNKTPYPDNGHVIGAFVKISQRTFLYYLSYPGYPHHDDIQRVLDDKRERADRCVRYVTTVDVLRGISESLPILNHYNEKGDTTIDPS